MQCDCIREMEEVGLGARDQYGILGQLLGGRIV